MTKNPKSLRPMVLSDIDETLRWHKTFVGRSNESAIRRFRKNGGLLIPITGAPAHHVPDFLISPIALCESGAVIIYENDSEQLPTVTSSVSPDELEALNNLRVRLGIDVQDGPCVILGKYRVLVEGPRFASFTLICGRHPLYPGESVDETPINEVADKVAELIENLRLPLRAASGTAATYSWLDVTTNFKKEHAVEWLMADQNQETAYFMGDGMNDWKAMSLPRVIPVAFKNSVPAIRDLAIERNGLFVNKNGPDGGVAEALEIISDKPSKAD